MRLNSHDIHLPSTAPTFLSSPQRIQGYTRFKRNKGFSWSAPTRSVLTSAELRQKACSDRVFPGTRLTLQTVFGSFLYTPGLQECKIVQDQTVSVFITGWGENQLDDIYRSLRILIASGHRWGRDLMCLYYYFLNLKSLRSTHNL